MEYIKTLVMGTDRPEIQRILSQLNSYNDLLLLSGEVGSSEALEVNYLTEQGEAVKIGELPDEILSQIEDDNIGDVRVDIIDFGVYKRADGTLKLWVGIDVKDESGKRCFNLPLIMGAGAAIGAAAVIAAIIYITLYRKKRS